LFFFFKYETGWKEDDFTLNVVLHPDDLPCFSKKEIEKRFYKFELKMDP